MIMMTAQARFSAMCAAMLDDDWRAAVDAEIDLEDTIEAMFAPVVVEPAPYMIDCESYMMGRQDSIVGRYNPPAGNFDHDDYVRGWNDAWAATQPAVKLTR